MSQEPDTVNYGGLSQEDGDRACENLHDQVQRARKVVSDYRAALRAPFQDNDNQQH